MELFSYCDFAGELKAIDIQIEKRDKYFSFVISRRAEGQKAEEEERLRELGYSVAGEQL